MLLLLSSQIFHLDFDIDIIDLDNAITPRLLADNCKIITIENDQLQKTLIINFEEGFDHAYHECKGPATWPEDQDKLRNKERLVAYEVKSTKTIDGYYDIGSIQIIKKDQISVPIDLQDFSFDKIEFNKEQNTLFVLFDDLTENDSHDQAMIYSMNMNGLTFNQRSFFVVNYETNDYKGYYAELNYKEWDGEALEGRKVAQTIQAKYKKPCVIESLCHCIDMIDNVNGDVWLPFDFKPHAKWNQHYTLYSDKGSTYIWDNEARGRAKVSNFPKMKKCMDFTIINAYDNSSMTKMFVFVDSDNARTDDCTIKACLGYMWFEIQEEMVKQLLIEFPKDLVQLILTFVREDSKGCNKKSNCV